MKKRKPIGEQPRQASTRSDKEQPKQEPRLITVSGKNYLGVGGKGQPNEDWRTLNG